MIILKWVCFGLLTLSSLLNLIRAVTNDDSNERLVGFVGFVITIIITFYIFFSKAG